MIECDYLDAEFYWITFLQVIKVHAYMFNLSFQLEVHWWNKKKK